MPRIQKLSAHEAQKIAAGEVVDRPANIVKELIENALDAGATTITVHIENGGKDLIRIIDNGCGMSPDDARMSIEHHATSKITCLDDLKALATFGFRGEALSSICSVSHVTLTTKEESALQGTQLSIEVGTVTQEKCVPSNTGTEIIITKLFHNVPARKKFLKKRETEFYQIQHLLQALCLLHRTVHFKLLHDGKLTLNCPPVSDITVRFAQLFEHTKTDAMLTLASQTPTLTITGAISDHQSFRYDRDHIFLFVNNRWIKNYALSRALLKGYMNVLPPSRFPTACIAITIAPDLVDINIHPRKEEVQFLHPRTVENMLQEAVKIRLEQNLTKSLPITTQPPITFISAQPMLNVEPIHMSMLYRQLAPAPRISYNFNVPPCAMQETIPQAETVPPHALPHQITGYQAETPMSIPATEHDYRLIGQYKKTYLLLDQDDGLFLIDQHAAHERILYELFSTRFNDVPTIALLFPNIVTLTHQELATIAPYLSIFEKNGIIVEQFSDHQLVVQSTPIHSKDLAFDDLIRHVISWIHEYSALDEDQFFKKINQKLHAQMACKAAVKAGDTLTHEQMIKLLHDLSTTENRLTCPHGRPTGFLLSVHEIEKKFKRKL